MEKGWAWMIFGGGKLIVRPVFPLLSLSLLHSLTDQVDCFFSIFFFPLTHETDSVMIALTQLLLLYLLVHQMELTRTPSTLSKISIWTIALMAIIDSYVFSLNVILGVVDVGHGGADGRGGGLGVWVGGFAAFAGAVIFGPVSVPLWWPFLRNRAREENGKLMEKMGYRGMR